MPIYILPALLIIYPCGSAHDFHNGGAGGGGGRLGSPAEHLAAHDHMYAFNDIYI